MSVNCIMYREQLNGQRQHNLFCKALNKVLHTLQSEHLPGNDNQLILDTPIPISGKKQSESRTEEQTIKPSFSHPFYYTTKV